MSVKKRTIVDLPDRHPYFKACRKGDLAVLRRFYEEGISVHASGPTRAEAMTEALASKNYAFMGLLFECGFEVDHPLDAFDSSALMFAVRADDPALVKHFLDRGADVNHRNYNDATPYLHAASGAALEILQLLEQRGADIFARDRQQWDAFRAATAASRYRTMDFLLSKGFDVDTRDVAGSTPLINAAQRGALDVCRWLLEHGADKNARGMSNKTALEWARANKHQAVVELLEKA